jgi:hypothetical protein
MLRLIATHYTTRFNMVAVPTHHALCYRINDTAPHDVGAVREPPWCASTWRNVVNAPPATPMIAIDHIALSSRAYAIPPTPSKSELVAPGLQTEGRKARRVATRTRTFGLGGAFYHVLLHRFLTCGTFVLLVSKRWLSYDAGFGQMSLPIAGSTAAQKRQVNQHAGLGKVVSNPPGLLLTFGPVSFRWAALPVTCGCHPANRSRNRLCILYRGVMCHWRSCEVQAAGL